MFDQIHNLVSKHLINYNTDSGILFNPIEIQLKKISTVSLFFFFYMQEADVGVQSVSITQARNQVISFMVPFDVDPMTILIPAPAEDSRLFACSKPFQMDVISHNLIIL